jgi:hypothetical protein
VQLKRQRRSDVPAFPPKMLRVFTKPTEEKLERRCQGIHTFLQVGLSIQHLLLHLYLRWRPKLTRVVTPLQSLLAIPRWQEHPEVRAFLDPDRVRRCRCRRSAGLSLTRRLLSYDPSLARAHTTQKRRLLEAAERAQERAAAWAVQSSRQR